MAKEGAQLMLGYHNTPNDGLVAEIRASGGVADRVRIDATNEEDCRAGVAATLEEYGRLDVAFNNHGVLPRGGLLHECPTEEFDWTIAANLKGVFLMMKHEVPAMLASGGGSIINTASLVGITADPMTTPYVAAKHGVVGLTKGAALDYAQQGIRVNAIAPGLTETAMARPIMNEAGFSEAIKTRNPMGRISQPDEQVGMVIYLASNESTFTTGQTFLVDGGQAAH